MKPQRTTLHMYVGKLLGYRAIEKDDGWYLFDPKGVRVGFKRLSTERNMFNGFDSNNLYYTPQWVDDLEAALPLWHDEPTFYLFPATKKWMFGYERLNAKHLCGPYTLDDLAYYLCLEWFKTHSETNT